MNPREEMSRLKEGAARIVDLAMAKGAGTAMATIQRDIQFLGEVRRGEIENLSEAQSQTVKLTVSKDGRRARVSSSDLSPDSVETLVGQAVAMCRYTDRDPFYSLPEKELMAVEDEELDLFDEDLLNLGVDERFHSIRELEDRVIARDTRLSSDGAKISTVAGASALANSLGVCLAEASTLVAVGVTAFAQDAVAQTDKNKGRKQSGHGSAKAHHLEDLEDRDAIAARAAENVLRKLGARKPNTGKFPVYFEPFTARSLWNNFLTAISGAELYRDESYLTQRLGTRVCANGMEIIEDPLMLRGVASRAFDNEGVASKKRALVEDGVLQGYLLSTYSANKLKMRSTGSAGGPANVLIAPGDLPRAEILRKMGTGVWVTSLFGQGVNIATGDYSRGATGLWVENGEVAYPIMEFTLNSHLDQMLQNIVALDNGVERGWSIQTPGLVIEEMTISGA